MPSDPALDGDDIQGNIFPGFRRKQQLHLGYGAPSEAILRAALAVLATRTTPLSVVLDHREARKQAFLADAAAPVLDDLWVNIALGAAALDRLGEAAIRKLDDGFDVGMRPAATGDPWQAKDAQGQPNPTNPANWYVGRPSQPLDLLVIAAFDDPAVAGLDAFLAQLAATGIQEIYREPGVRLPGDSEHFGFADGISEVGVRGTVQINGARQQLTTRYGVPPLDGVEFGKPGQPLVWPGQFLVGVATSATETDNSPARYKNGSFLVFRRLSQDVAAFIADTTTIAQGLSTAGTPLAADHLQALIIGRWPSGNALMRHQANGAPPDDILSINYFSYGSASPDLQLPSGPVLGAAPDPAPDRGLYCPAFAHVHKVNPRDLPTDKGDRDRTRSFQMFRRGIPFGPAYDRTNPAAPDNATPRGLLFFSYQRAIALQFQRLNSNWMNSSTGPTPGGFDLLVGQNVPDDVGLEAARTATLYSAPAPAAGQTVTALNNWVKPTGGAYLFAPSLTLIRSLAGTQSADAHLLTAKLALSADWLADDDLTRLDAAKLRHDGEVRVAQEAGHEVLVEAKWPMTALLPGGAGALSGASMQRLDLSGEHFPTDVLDAHEAHTLAGDDALDAVQLDGTSLSGLSVTTLVGQLRNLVELNLAGCDVDDADLRKLANLRPTLSSLSLGLAAPRVGHRFTAPRLNAGVIRTLEAFLHLRRLSLRGVSLTDAAVEASTLWDRLEALDVGETSIGDNGVIRLSSAGTLREVRVDQTGIGDAGAEALLALPLETLTLSWTRVTAAALRTADAPGLRRLELTGLAVDDSIAPTLGRMKALRHLDVSQTKVGDRVAEALAGLHDLATVNVSGTALTVEGLAALTSAPISVLSASSLPVNGDLLMRLSRSPSLTKVSLSLGSDWRGLDAINCEVQLEAEAPTAGEAPARLATLFLAGDLPKPLAVDLGKRKTLRSLTVQGDLNDARFDSGYEGLREVRAERAGLVDGALSDLLRLPAIEALYISGNPIAGSFGDWRGLHIHTIELRDTAIDDVAAAAIAKLPKLHCLDVPGTHVTSAGVVALATGAQNLQSLAVDGHQVDAASAEALANHARLSELYLYGTNVTADTLRALARVRLREMTLIDTGLTNAAVPILAALPALRRVSLGREFSRAAVESLIALRPDVTVYWNDSRTTISRRP